MAILRNRPDTVNITWSCFRDEHYDPQVDEMERKLKSGEWVDTRTNRMGRAKQENYLRLMALTDQMLRILDDTANWKRFKNIPNGVKYLKTIITLIQKIDNGLSAQTPAPNDYMELGNHSEFVGVMTRAEMLSMFFCHDGGDTSKWRLKGHAREMYWQWMATWAVFMESPTVLGYDIEGYDLPPLNVHEVIVDGKEPIKAALSLMERREARRESMDARCAEAARIANGTGDQFVVWCDLNAESELLHKLIPGSVEIRGSDDPEKKAQAVIDFTNGDIRCLVSKSSIFGFGVNWQQCKNMIFVGLSDSYEAAKRGTDKQISLDELLSM